MTPTSLDEETVTASLNINTLIGGHVSVSVSVPWWFMSVQIVGLVVGSEGKLAVFLREERMLRS